VAPIAPRHGSFPDLITDGVDGALFEPHDVSGLAGVLRQVDERPERFVELGSQGRRTYEQRFSPDVVLDKLLGVYRFALANPVVPRPRTVGRSAS